ncbi:MAG: hypothetical protein ACR2L0_00930 [Gaiellaceae bacterium]
MSSETRSVAIAVVSTVVFVAVVAVVVVNSPGWDEVRRFFFNSERFRESFPTVAEAFLVNVKLFCLARC